MFSLKDTIEFNGEEYLIDKFIGQGGMGHVFSITNKNDNSKLAMKSLHYFLPDDSQHRSLMNEWDKAQTIKHPNVIDYIGFHDGLSDPKIPYLIMELANDGSLEDLLKAQTEFFTESECLDIFHQIIDGMEAVNSVLVHRDIKPDNIFIDQGVFKIADFGLAKIASDKTRSKTFKGWGTEPYIAPEAYKSEKNTIQMDMYSIGHVFYQIAGMKHAYGLQADWEKAHLTAVAEPVNTINTNISPKIASIIQKLIQKRPSNRYEQWDDVRSELISSIDHVGQHKPAIDKILLKKVSRDVEAQKILSAQQIIESELKRKSDLIDFQFADEIVKNLNEFVDNFNKVSGSDFEMKQSKILPKYGSTEYRIMFDGKSIEVSLHKINEGDFLKTQVEDGWGDIRLNIIKPELNGKEILAWGTIKASNHKGLNIILLASDSEEYGDWFLLTNKNGGFSRQQPRAEPFAFEYAELPKEIQNVGAMHIYSTNVSVLDTDKVIEFIVDTL